MGLNIPRQTCQCNVKHNRLQGKTVLVLPAGCPCSVRVIAANYWRKSQSPRYFTGLGGNMVTNDWYISLPRKMVVR